jgi:hypothetical protein
MEIYTHRHSKDGNVGIGIMQDYSETLETLASQYLSTIPDKSATTHHSYYTELTGTFKTNFEKIQFAKIWQRLRVGAFESPDTFAAVLHNMVEMNEIYYSNPKPNFKAGPLYGAAANLIPHRDCILFYFPGIRIYRVIIGATDGNHDTVTEFITHGVERRLNTGEYMVFDFDRTLHQVKKTGQMATPRVLLKLHFLACDTRYAASWYSFAYIRFAYCCYVAYYRVARYTEQIGTDPTTFIGFFFGILWEYPFYPKVRYSVGSAYLGVIAMLPKTHGIPICATSIREVVMYSALDMMTIYLCVVCFFWFRHAYFKRMPQNCRPA